MAKGLDLSDPEQSCAQQIRRCHRRYTTILNNVLAKYDFLPGCWYYLRVLWIKDGINQKSLSEKAYVAENTTVTIVNAMLKSGLVRRERSEDDGRQFNVYLTEKGKALEKEAIGYVRDINKVALDGIELKDVRTCLKVLKKIAENLEASVGS